MGDFMQISYLLRMASYMTAHIHNSYSYTVTCITKTVLRTEGNRCGQGESLSLLWWIRRDDNILDLSWI